MSSERRRHRRRIVKQPATVVWDEGLTRVPAFIVDESAFGVRVRLSAEMPIVGACYLLFAHRIEPCNLVWQTGRAAGLAFVG
jgi:hypothetical protein